jgi:hypothetical protein
MGVPRAMGNSLIKRVVGGGAFLLPAMMAAVGEQLDHSRFRYDPLYTSLIPYVFWGAVILAAVVPAALVMTARMPLTRRIGMVGVILCGLLLEFYLIIVLVLSNIH